MSFNKLLAKRTKNMDSTAIKEILKVVSQPGMISLAGGLPAPESFPMDIMKKLCVQVLDKYGDKAFQYSAVAGLETLRTALAKNLKKRGVKTSADDILISSGSQQALDSLGKILISEGDKIAVEAPTYLGAIMAFNAYMPEYISMETDEQGLIPSSLEKVLKKHKIKFVYLVPTFQNPTGRTIPENRRKEIARIIKKYNALLVEDDPYSALRFKGNSVPTIQSMAPDNVVYLGTLSKVFAPGLRLGFSVAPKEITHWLAQVKQGSDLHTSTFNQALAAEYISEGFLEKQIPKIIEIYKPKQKAMLDALEEFFPSNFTWSKPDGGLFIWAIGSKDMDTEKLYWQAVKEKVAYVPGKFFYTEKGQGSETMRLNFSMANEVAIKKAVKTLAEVIKKSNN